VNDRQFFAESHSSELPLYVGVLEAVPDDQLDWRPHSKSRSARELIGHLIGHEQDLLELLDTGDINHRNQVSFGDKDQGLAMFRKNREAAAAAVKATDDETWESPGRFLVDGRVIHEQPRFRLAWLLAFDSIHHRGQLSTYLRPMGGKVPAIYGPSADSGG
jgi:uncharacterized damage-inducible protein DinB